MDGNDMLLRLPSHLGKLPIIWPALICTFTGWLCNSVWAWLHIRALVGGRGLDWFEVNWTDDFVLTERLPSGQTVLASLILHTS